MKTCPEEIPESLQLVQYQVGISLVVPKAVVVRLVRRPHPRREDHPLCLLFLYSFELQRLCTVTATRNDLQNTQHSTGLTGLIDLLKSRACSNDMHASV